MFPPKVPISLLQPICWAWVSLFSRYIVLRTDHITKVLVSAPEGYPRGSCLWRGVGGGGGLDMTIKCAQGLLPCGAELELNGPGPSDQLSPILPSMELGEIQSFYI